MIRIEKGVVTEAKPWDHEDFQELTVRTETGMTCSALAHIEETGLLREGDRVLLNATAERLKLGSGGYHFVIAAEGAALLPPESRAEAKGHIMKLRYTALQRSVLAAEEPESPHHRIFDGKRDLEGMPVLIGEIHSMLPCAASWLRYRAGMERGRRIPSIAYVMCEGGALPIGFSKHAAALRRLGWISETITYGHSYGGSIETINKYTALIAARHVAKADVCIAVMGPGIAGTGTPLGHSGVEAGELSNAVSALGGVPFMIPRISETDARERHSGLSHHLIHTLDVVAQQPVHVPLPAGLDGGVEEKLRRQVDQIPSRHSIQWIEESWERHVPAAIGLYPARITTMGRAYEDDPAYFHGVCAASEAAWRQYILPT